MELELSLGTEEVKRILKITVHPKKDVAIGSNALESSFMPCCS